MNKTPTVWQLARLAEVSDPDSLDSPGAKWLRLVASNVEDVTEAVAAGEELTDVVYAVADELVPVYTHEVWQVFVDLGAWGEDVSEWFDFTGDTTDLARAALRLIGERLLTALVERGE